MSRFAVGNLFLLASMLCNVGSQFLIKKVLDDMRANGSGSFLTDLLVWERLVRAGSGMLLLVAGFGCWVFCLARLDLSYAYAAASGSVVFVTLFSGLYLGELVTARVWAGTILVLVGIVLVGPSR